MKNKGFTLIELLAVITIMGILMLVAIPAVSRTIENSRRDTFATTAVEYLNAVRNGILADNIECKVGNVSYLGSSAPDGWYYFEIDTTKQGTIDLMEKVGKSSFGNADLKGVVAIQRTTTNAGTDKQKTVTNYWMQLTDSGKHGFNTWLKETEIKRSNISTATTGLAATTVGTAADKNPSGEAISGTVGVCTVS